MRYLFSLALAGLMLFALAGKGEAWYPRGYYPGYYAPPVYSYGAYAGPYGQRSFYNFNAYPTPYGYSTLYSYGNYVRPYVSAPFHSVYFNPYLNTYQYGTGYMNTPTFSYFYGY